MDNIQEKIAEIMSDPEALNQVQSLGKMLGLGSADGNKQQLGSISELMNNTKNSGAESEVKRGINNCAPLSAGGVPTEMMNKMMKLMPIFQQINQEDDVTRLLQALRPFLSEEKCRKLESAKKMLQIMKIIPLLRQGGLMDFEFL